MNNKRNIYHKLCIGAGQAILLLLFALGLSACSVTKTLAPADSPNSTPVCLISFEIICPPDPVIGFTTTEDGGVEYTRQIGLNVVNAEDAFERGYFGAGATVAVVGSGVLTSHVDLTANLLPGVRFTTNIDSEVPVTNDITDTIIGRGIGSGTHAAGIIGAEFRGNVGIMGVAPSAKILPIQTAVSAGISLVITDGLYNGLRYAVTNTVTRVQVINNGWSLEATLGVGALAPISGGSPTPVSVFRLSSSVGVPLFRAFIDKGFYSDGLTAQFAQMAADLNGKDAVVVVPSGSHGWNEVSGRSTYFIDLVSSATVRTVNIPDFLARYTDDVAGTLSTLTIGVNEASGWSLAPHYQSSLEDHWVNVIAIGPNGDRIENVRLNTNACGDTMAWCIAAPGFGISTTYNHNAIDDSYNDDVRGTEIAAAHVAGALALLRSRFGEVVPMSVVVDIMFATATDRGVPGVDEIYGHGLLNIGAAISVQGRLAVIVDPNLVVLPDLNDPTSAFDTSTVNVEYTNQRGLSAINADAAFSRNYFGQGVTVVIVGPGVLTTHVDLNANILTELVTNGVIFEIGAPDVPDEDFLIHEDDDDAGDKSRGTQAAGIIAAANNGAGIIGVAPSVRILPIKTSLSVAHHALRYAITANNVNVIHNAWSLPTQFEPGTLSAVDVSVRSGDFPLLRAFIDNDFYSGDITAQFTIIANDLVDDFRVDSVVVVPAGNFGWNERSYATLSVEYREGGTDREASLTDFIAGYSGGNSDRDIIELSTLTIGMNEASGWALAPHYDERLLGRWVNVVAATIGANSTLIAESSNACGDTMAWCITAPGVDISTTFRDADANNINSYGTASGSDIAAAHVAGALAVLRSRFGDAVPMSVILTIMLEAADDLGSPEIYGHGLLNIEAAITLQGVLNLATGEATPTFFTDSVAAASGASLASSFSQLSPALSGLRAKLAGVSVAVRYLGNRHYNTSLDKLLTAVVAPEELPVLGNAAEQLLDTPPPNQLMDNLYVNQSAKSGQLLGLNYTSEHLRLNYTICQDNDDCAKPVWSHFGTSAAMDDIAPYYATDKQQAMVSVPLSLPAAFGDSIEVFAGGGLGEKAKEFTYSQLGMRWHALPGWYAEYSRITENDTVLGGEFNGGLGLEGAQSHQFRIAGRYDIGNNWQLFGLYALGIGEAEGGNNSLFKSFNYRYKAWRAGLTKHALFRSDDELRLGYRHYGALDSASASISRGVSNNGVLSRQTDTLNWSESGIQSFLLGYAIRRSDNISIGLGFEHARGDRLGSDNALSLIWKKRF